ncbi:HIG1 domain-containing protein [Sphingopyxis sp.]|uniref:HIG1 domain-containing protein n=1 Tax=Sphingopyxis sp. TaxID=1908224 RepID=UPI003D1305A6
MNILLIIGVVVAAGFVLFSLARGLFYFSQGHQAVIDGKAEENQILQNKMMMSRVKWQAITIILIVLIGLLAAGQ